MSFMLLASLFSAQAVADVQQPAVAAPAVAAVPASPEKPKKEQTICKTDDADSGSHMSRRVCRTAQEWNNTSSSRSGFSISGEAMQGH
jgi:hypothetical protein